MDIREEIEVPRGIHRLHKENQGDRAMGVAPSASADTQSNRA